MLIEQRIKTGNLRTGNRTNNQVRRSLKPWAHPPTAITIPAKASAPRRFRRSNPYRHDFDETLVAEVARAEIGLFRVKRFTMRSAPWPMRALFGASSPPVDRSASRIESVTTITT